MKTRYNEIVHVEAIGQKNVTAVNELLRYAAREASIPATSDVEKVLLIGIDVQNDFMEHGELPVLGASSDVANLTRFLYNNMEKVTKVAVSLDTHQPQQVFHAAWWSDAFGREPNPYTTISFEDIATRKWRPRFSPEATQEYVEKLEATGKKQLMIWPYHCIQGTFGAALEGQFSNMVYFHSLVRESEVFRIVKGLDPLSEMYGIVKPEYDPKGYVNTELLAEVMRYDKVIFGGEAKSHCVLESLVQLVHHFSDVPDVPRRMYVLEDCMSSISGFEDATEQTLKDLERDFGVNRVTSETLAL